MLLPAVRRTSLGCFSVSSPCLTFSTVVLKSCWDMVSDYWIHYLRRRGMKRSWSNQLCCGVMSRGGLFSQKFNNYIKLEQEWRKLSVLFFVSHNMRLILRLALDSLSSKLNLSWRLSVLPKLFSCADKLFPVGWTLLSSQTFKLFSSYVTVRNNGWNNASNLSPECSISRGENLFLPVCISIECIVPLSLWCKLML